MSYRSLLLSSVSLAASVALACIPSVVSAQQVMDEVLVEADRILPPNQIESLPGDPAVPPVHDAGEFLRSVPGVSAGRMGGHGIDPVIRGQKSNQLNIINDGAFIHGGCPNRMDPPSSTVNLELIDRVTVTKGYQSVANGPGATGGTVRFERDTPVLSKAKPYSVKAGGGYDSNGAVRDSWGEAAGGTQAGYVRGGGKWKAGENYTDGQGKKVRSGFSQFGGNLDVGWTSNDSLLSLGYERNKTEDALFAGAGMDAPLDETDIVRLKFEKRNIEAGALNGLRLNTYGSMLDHVMDNFSLRPQTAASAMLVESESDTYGGQAAADLKIADADLTVGVDVQVNRRDARRYSKANGVGIVDPANLQSIAWPDVQIGQYGLFGEGTVPLNEESRVKLGARYDYVQAEYGAADLSAATGGANPTANSLYQAYYGVRAGDRSEHNAGGLVRYEHDVGAATFFTGVSRSVRTADATERGMAMRGAAASNWVGNPDIKPEAHHQLDLGTTTQAKTWSAAGSLFYDHVQDFILRDTARGQDGILQSNGATVYRNVEAALAGIELGGKIRFADDWMLAADAAYIYAENLDDNRAIAQIPPLNGKISLAYAPDGWSIGTRMRWAATQTRVDDRTAVGSGQDAAKTSGYAVFDLFGSYELVSGVDVDAGVTNLLDHSYAEHLNRAAAFDTTVAQVNEPGRSFYLRGRIGF